ncbi:hypothetical protein BDW71DRAFT_211728 [Aspergillus fruticulosus]
MSTRQFAGRFGHYNHDNATWEIKEPQQPLGTGFGYAEVILGLLCATPLNECLGCKNSLRIQSAVAAASLSRLRSIPVPDAKVEIAQLTSNNSSSNGSNSHKTTNSLPPSSRALPTVSTSTAPSSPSGRRSSNERRGSPLLPTTKPPSCSKLLPHVLHSVTLYVIGIVGNLVGVAVADRLGRRHVLLFSAALLSACMLAICSLTAQPKERCLQRGCRPWRDWEASISKCDARGGVLKESREREKQNVEIM